MRAQVQRLQESRLTIRGDGDQDPVASERFRQGPSLSPNCIASQSAMLKEWSVQGCKRAEHKTYSPSVGSCWLRRRRLTIVEADEMTFSSPLTLPPKFGDKITIEDRVRDSLWYIFLKRYCTKFWQRFRVWPKELPKRFPQLVISVTLCENFWSDLKIFRMEIKNASATL